VTASVIAATVMIVVMLRTSVTAAAMMPLLLLLLLMLHLLLAATAAAAAHSDSALIRDVQLCVAAVAITAVAVAQRCIRCCAVQGSGFMTSLGAALDQTAHNSFVTLLQLLK
jgi:hypothetical protein